jgi:hypothetical protein
MDEKAYFSCNSNVQPYEIKSAVLWIPFLLKLL